MCRKTCKVRRVSNDIIRRETLSPGARHETAMRIQQVFYELTSVRLLIRLDVDSEGLHKITVTTIVLLQKRLKINIASLRQGLRRGEVIHACVRSFANLTDPRLKANPKSSGQLEPPNDSMKRLLTKSLRFNCTDLRRIRQVTKLRRG